MITATGIPTALWNKIHELLTADQWQVTYAYDNFDAGIDFAFIILEKNGEEILMGWDNWFEGELGCPRHFWNKWKNLCKPTSKSANQ